MPLTATPPSRTALSDREARIGQLTELITDFSGVVDRLQTSHDALTDRVARLQRELAAKNRLLGDKQKQLERRNRLAALGEMAAGLAHEIRNPLGGINLYAGLLADDMLEGSEAMQLVERIQAGVARLERTVSHVLRFAGEVDAQPRPAAVKPLLEEVMELARPAAQRRGVELTLACEVHEADLDPDLFVQATLNLVLNAIDVATRIRVEASEAQGGRLVLRVTDNGPGLPPEVDAEKLFDPFFTTKEAGTGLGLSIVHRIAEAHGGVVTARNLGSDSTEEENDGDSSRPCGGAAFEMII